MGSWYHYFRVPGNVCINFSSCFLCLQKLKTWWTGFSQGLLNPRTLSWRQQTFVGMKVMWDPERRTSCQRGLIEWRRFGCLVYLRACLWLGLEIPWRNSTICLSSMSVWCAGAGPWVIWKSAALSEHQKIRFEPKTAVWNSWLENFFLWITFKVCLGKKELFFINTIRWRWCHLDWCCWNVFRDFETYFLPNPNFYSREEVSCSVDWSRNVGFFEIEL